jgi:hypothetical protein
LLGLHLLVPPLALLILAVGCVVMLLCTLVPLGASMVPAVALAGVLGAALVLVFVAWLAGGRAFLSGSALLKAPLYVLWKVPMYLGFVRKPEAEWQRTPRRPD